MPQHDLELRAVTALAAVITLIVSTMTRGCTSS